MPQTNMIAVYPMTLAGSALKYEPTLHIFYSERVMDIRDELPKYADMPEEYGGSGELIEQTGHTGWRA